MKPVKKIEIISGNTDPKNVIRLLKKHNIRKYTIIKGAGGSGTSFDRDMIGLTSVFENAYIMAACSEEQLEDIKEPLRQFLAETGGICLVSDAQMLLP